MAQFRQIFFCNWFNFNGLILNVLKRVAFLEHKVLVTLLDVFGMQESAAPIFHYASKRNSKDHN